MNALWEKGLSLVLGLAAVSIAGVELHREFAPRAPERGANPARYQSDWRNMLPAARFIGDRDAPITIVEFMDLQCPFCRRFNSAVAAARATYPNQIATAFVHFPLAGHGQAHAAAHAVECAGTFGKFATTVDVLFENQPFLGKRPWSAFAAGAGVADTAAFAKCMADSTTSGNIDVGLALGKKIGITGTPTIFLNGWRYVGAPSDTELVRAVGDLLAGKRPYKGFPKEGLPLASARSPSAVKSH